MGEIILGVIIAGCLIAFIGWACWDSGYDRGWMDHAEGKPRRSSFD